MTRRDRRGDDRQERRDSQPEDEQQRRSGEADLQEGDSLTALKAILSKVASLLKPLQLSQEESIRLVEQLYGSVLDMDLQLAGEADDTRKSTVLSLIQNASIARDGDRIVVEFPKPGEHAAESASAAGAEAAPAGADREDRRPPRPPRPQTAEVEPPPSGFGQPEAD